MERLLDQNVSQPRFLAALLTGFSLLAAVLALVGVYGLLSFSVSRRVRELGVRMALGAGRGAVARLVLARAPRSCRSAWSRASTASACRACSTLLFGVGPAIRRQSSRWRALAAAASSPACRRRCASRIDPVVALREE